MAKLTLEQKRLEALRRQLYGKGESVSKTSISNMVDRRSEKQNDSRFTIHDKLPTTTDTQTVAFLKKDLLKIFILTTAALTLQLLLYLATKNGLLVVGW